MRRVLISATLAWLATAFPAEAAPGVGDPIYGAHVETGVTEFEVRYGRLAGKSADGEDGLIVELEHALSSRLAVAGLVETARDPNSPRIVTALALEAIYTTGRIKAFGLDTAIYAEVKHGLRGDPDVIEVKGLFEHQAGKFDSRLNLIGEKPLRSAEPIKLGYAASADWALVDDEVRVGLAAFGDLGTTLHFGGRQEHYLGPEVKLEIEHIGRGEFEVELGYLRAFGAARDRSNGQARLLIGYTTHF